MTAAGISVVVVLDVSTSAASLHRSTRLNSLSSHLSAKIQLRGSQRKVAVFTSRHSQTELVSVFLFMSTRT